MLNALKMLVPDSWKKWLAWLIVVLAVLAANYFLGSNYPTPTPPDWARAAHGNSYQFGWIDNPQAVDAIVDNLPFKAFSDTPAGKADDPLPQAVYLWEVYKKCDPRGPPAKNQGPVGCCVSFGTNNAILRTMACDIVINKQPNELRDIAEEVTYAGSRVEIGGGRIRGDGSVGAWAAQFVQKYGIVSRDKHGKYDLSTYDPARARSWGQSGVPEDLEHVAREHPVKDITQIKSWADAKRALAQGYAIAVCSSQGFSMQRDTRGVATAQGRWEHCMCIDGYHLDGTSEFGHIENSWGPSAHTGPVGWGNPSTAGFWAKSSVIDAMLKSGEGWTFAGVKGFPARKPDWFVQRPDRNVRPGIFVAQTRRFDRCDFFLAP